MCKKKVNRDKVRCLNNYIKKKQKNKFLWSASTVSTVKIFFFYVLYHHSCLFSIFSTLFFSRFCLFICSEVRRCPRSHSVLFSVVIAKTCS